MGACRYPRPVFNQPKAFHAGMARQYAPSGQRSNPARYNPFLLRKKHLQSSKRKYTGAYHARYIRSFRLAVRLLRIHKLQQRADCHDFSIPAAGLHHALYAHRQA